MSNTCNFKPNIAIPPGETLREVFISMNITKEEFSKMSGISVNLLDGILSGKTPITVDIAEKLEKTLHAPAYFWINLEDNYQNTLERIHEENCNLNDTEILKLIPYSAISKLGWFPKANTIENKIENLKLFFGVNSLIDIKKTQPVAFRRIDHENISPYAIAAWLRMGELFANKICTQPFDEEKLYRNIPKLRELTKLAPTEFQVKLTDICSQCGIAVVAVPHLPNTYVNGATKWLNPDKAMIQLSLRNAYADIFWFSFFHELGHILLHGKKRAFLEVDDEICVNRTKEENEADNFASDCLIPNKEYIEYISNCMITKESIISFANKINIDPSIVLGRLQHDKLVPYTAFHDLKRRFRWKNIK